MKKLIYIALILLGAGILSSCGKEGGGSSNSIIGSWECVYTSDDFVVSVGEVWTFEKGGVFLMDGYPAAQWRYDESQDVYKVGASGYFKVLSISSTQLEIDYDDGRDGTYKFKKVK